MCLRVLQQSVSLALSDSFLSDFQFLPTDSTSSFHFLLLLSMSREPLLGQTGRENSLDFTHYPSSAPVSSRNTRMPPGRLKQPESPLPSCKSTNSSQAPSARVSGSENKSQPVPESETNLKSQIIYWLSLLSEGCPPLDSSNPEQLQDGRKDTGWSLAKFSKWTSEPPDGVESDCVAEAIIDGKEEPVHWRLCTSNLETVTGHELPRCLPRDDLATHS
jgi:hypothetical protein